MIAPSFLRSQAIALGPAEVRWRGGRRASLGYAGGRRRFVGLKGPQNQSRGGGQGPPPLLCARCARPPPPRDRWNFSPSKQSIHHPFPALPSRKPNEPAAPHERRASIIRCKPRKVFQQVFPRFFQKRQGGRAERRQWRKKRGGSPVSKGVEGSRFSGDAQRPLRTARGAGSPPHGAPKGGWQPPA